MNQTFLSYNLIDKRIVLFLILRMCFINMLLAAAGTVQCLLALQAKFGAEFSLWYWPHSFLLERSLPFSGAETKVRERSGTRRVAEGIWKVEFWVRGEVGCMDYTQRGQGGKRRVHRLDKNSQHFWWMRKTSRMGGIFFCFSLNLPPVALVSSSISWTTYPPCYSIFPLLHLLSQQAQLPYLQGAWEADQGRICRGGKSRDKPASWYKRPGSTACCSHCRGGRLQMAIAFTVIAVWRNLYSCSQTILYSS